MKTYLIPGLGFDNRIFERLELKGIEFSYLNWIEPRKNESIKDYAIRFSNRIDASHEDLILIGHSLGGIMAQEISAIRPVTKIILISSIKSRTELPTQFKVMKPLLLYKLFSKELTTKTIKFWGKYHDYETPEEQLLVIDMVNNQSNNYLQWALKQLSIWHEPTISPNTKIFQIHGDLDRTFPLKLIKKPDMKIEKAGHFMVYRKSALINEIILKELKKEL